MKRTILCAFAAILAVAAPAQEPALDETAAPQAAPATNAPAEPPTISIQQMLVIGPSGLKLHSLAMITQGKFQGEIDDSFMPGFKVCAEDPALPVRSVTARLLGQYFVKDRETPDPEAVALLVQLAGDKEKDVQYSAVYYGLTQIIHKSDEVVELLVDTAADHRDQGLYDRIVTSLQSDRERVTAILDARLAQGGNIAVYEIYEDFTGRKPGDAAKYMDMPSSRPRLFIIKGEGSDSEAFKSELEKVMQEAGIGSAHVSVSGTGDNFVLLLKTYITRDNLAVEQKLAGSSRFRITQEMWLTPELEIQIEAMENK